MFTLNALPRFYPPLAPFLANNKLKQSRVSHSPSRVPCHTASGAHNAPRRACSNALPLDIIGDHQLAYFPRSASLSSPMQLRRPPHAFRMDTSAYLQSVCLNGSLMPTSCDTAARSDHVRSATVYIMYCRYVVYLLVLFAVTYLSPIDPFRRVAPKSSSTVKTQAAGRFHPPTSTTCAHRYPLALTQFSHHLSHSCLRLLRARGKAADTGRRWRACSACSQEERKVRCARAFQERRPKIS